MQKVYVIKYVAFYRNSDPFDPEVEIYDDLFFEDYQTAFDFAKECGLKVFEIDTLNVYRNESE